MTASEPMIDTLPGVSSSQSAASRRKLPRLFYIILTGIAAVIVTWFSPLGAQKRNLLAAQRHADEIAPRVHADARFKQIKVLTYTGKGGCLYIGGSVKSTDDAEALRLFVAATKPPVRTWFMVFISTEDPRKPEVAHLPDLFPDGVYNDW